MLTVFSMDVSDILTTISIVVIGFFGIACILGVIHSFFLNKTRANEINKRNKNIYEFIFDFNKKQVTYFKRYNASKIEKYSFKDFYKKIPDPRKLGMFKIYLSDLNNGNNKSLNSEIDILVGEDEFISFYFVEEMKSSNSILHLVGYPISYSKGMSHFVNNSSGISIGTAYLRKHRADGYMIYIRIFPLDREVIQEKANIIINDLKTICIAFTGESNLRQRLNLGEDDKNGFGIIDYTDESLEEYKTILNNLSRKLQARLELSGYSSVFDFFIGVAQNEFFKDPIDCLEEIKNLTYFHNENNNKVEWYNKVNDDSIEKSLVEKHELLQLIEGNNREKKIESLYLPLIDADTCSLFGFYTKTVAYSTKFKSLNDMFEAAHEHGLVNELSNVVVKRLIGIYYSTFVKVFQNRKGKCPQKLFIQLSKFDIDSIFNTLSEVKHLDECNLVFVISESVLNEIVEKDIDRAFKLLEVFKTKNYELCLRIKDRDFPWTRELYQLFDYFLFTKHINVSREAVETSSSFRAILNKLEIYNKPIISVGVDTKSDFKVIYENNIRIVGGKLFGEPREIIIPPNLSKINNLIKK